MNARRRRNTPGPAPAADPTPGPPNAALPQSVAQTAATATAAATAATLNEIEASRPDRILPPWLRKTLAYSVAVLLLAALTYLVIILSLKVALIAFALLVALLLTALFSPFHLWLVRRSVPSSLAAVLSILLLLGVPTGVGALIYQEARMQVEDVSDSFDEGMVTAEEWLVEGPLQLERSEVPDTQDAVTYLGGIAPNILGALSATLSVVAALLFAVVALFFLLNDGRLMWGWFLSWILPQYRTRADRVGRQVWMTLSGYVRGTVLVALMDAIGIGLGLFVVGVPLWLSLALLTFLGAFVPILGALLAGTVAVVVTFVTNGLTAALIIAGVVLLVQQLESNVLQPVIMNKMVRLHPLVILTSVSMGTLLLGIAGAVIAVPLVAVVYRVASELADRPHGSSPGERRPRIPLVSRHRTGASVPGRI